MARTYIVLSLFFIFSSFIASARSVDTLHVTLDMRMPIQEGWFNPSSETVGLRGDTDPLSWSRTLKASDSGSNGIYELKIPFQLDEEFLTIELKIKVDGEDNPDDGWQVGRNHSVTIQRELPNLLRLAWQDEAPPPQSTVSGHVEVIEDFDSGDLAPRDIYVYLPPDYFDSRQSYPVLYMHDGQTLFDASITGQEWGLDEAAESLIESGKLKPLIIVGIGNTKNRMDEYTPTRQVWHHDLQRQMPSSANGPLSIFTGTFITESNDSIHFIANADTLFAMIPGSTYWQQLMVKSDSEYYLPQAGITFKFQLNGNKPVDRITADKAPMGGDGDIYADFLINTLKPYIDQNFRTKPEREWTALGGASLGGLITLHIGLNHRETFGKLLVLSPSVWWDNRQILKTVQMVNGPASQRIFLYVGTGESERTVENVETLKSELLKSGWKENQIEFIEAAGAGHDESAWSEQAVNMLLFL